MGSYNGYGYGILYMKKRQIAAHRWAYELFKGPIPTGLVVHHTCGNHWCVNPDHLEAIDKRLNVSIGGKRDRRSWWAGHNH